jgi:aerobic carbon-monoxide dehydrogenase large subunit
VRTGHLQTPSPFTVLGIKGMGEGGAIAPPAAIANAVTDALREQGVAINVTPITPERVWLALHPGPDGHDGPPGNGPAPGPDGGAAWPGERP